MSINFPSRLSWENFHRVIIEGLKVYAFYLAVLSLFRLFFILWLNDYWGPNTAGADILLALWRGSRLSMQTAGALTLVSFVPAFAAHYLLPKSEKYLWLGINGILLAVLSVLYMASFPYYRIYRMNFNQMLFTGMNEDWGALFWTMVDQYALPARFAGAMLLTFVLWQLLRKLLVWQMPLLPIAHWPLWGKMVVRAAFLYLVYIAVLLGIFGGSLGWQTAVDWENAGVTKDEFLNEAILDNPQAIYRAYNLNSRMLACNGLDFTMEDIRLLAANLSGKPADTDNLDVYLQKNVQQGTDTPPRHVFVILSESLANWPLLAKYKDIPIAEELRALIAEGDTDYCPTFLPNGASTVSAVTGTVAGVADANLYLTTMPESFAAPYPTASAPQMARLGYETNFFYAGPATWERIGAFTQAQGFQHFYSRGDFGDVPGSVWGCEDECLYANIMERLTDAPSFNIILNASNHSPYDVDVEAKGFDKEKVRAALPAADQQDEELLRELGHYWYAQRELVKFVREVKAKYPDSLFVIVGDHGDRYNIEKQPDMYARYGIPFIVTGKNIHKGTLLADSAGSQIDIFPTLMELTAPKGTSYMALGQSLTTTSTKGVNYGFWITRTAIGKADTVPLVPEAIAGGETPVIDDQAMQDYINAIRAISWWRPKYGPILDQKILDEKGR